MNGNEVEKRVRQLQIIVGAMAGGVFLYTIVAAALVMGGIMGGDGAFGNIVPPLTALVVVLLLALAPVVRRRMLESGRAADTDEVVQRWGNATIVGHALREGAGLLGVTIGLVTGSVAWILGLGVVSLTAMLLGWPRGDEVQQHVRRLEAGM